MRLAHCTANAASGSQRFTARASARRVRLRIRTCDLRAVVLGGLCLTKGAAVLLSLRHTARLCAVIQRLPWFRRNAAVRARPLYQYSPQSAFAQYPNFSSPRVSGCGQLKSTHAARATGARFRIATRESVTFHPCAFMRAAASVTDSCPVSPVGCAMNTRRPLA